MTVDRIRKEFNLPTYVINRIAYETYCDTANNLSTPNLMVSIDKLSRLVYRYGADYYKHYEYCYRDNRYVIPIDYAIYRHLFDIVYYKLWLDKDIYPYSSSYVSIDTMKKRYPLLEDLVK